MMLLFSIFPTPRGPSLIISIISISSYVIIGLPFSLTLATPGTPSTPGNNDARPIIFFMMPTIFFLTGVALEDRIQEREGGIIKEKNNGKRKAPRFPGGLDGYRVKAGLVGKGKGRAGIGIFLGIGGNRRREGAGPSTPSKGFVHHFFGTKTFGRGGLAGVVGRIAGVVLGIGGKW